MDLLEARGYHLRHIEGTRRLKPGQDPTKHPTYRAYAATEWRYLEYLESHQLGVGLERLNPYLVDDYLVWRRGDSRGTRGGQMARKHDAAILKVWAGFLWRRGVYDRNPLEKLVEPRVPKLHRIPFTADEARAIVSAVAFTSDPVRDRAVLLLLATTGCRVGELCGLELTDVLDGSGNLTGDALFRFTKNGHPRAVPYRNTDRKDGGRCFAALKQWLRVRVAQPSVQAVFTTSEGWPLTERRVREMHTLVGNRSGVHPCHPHLWRHTSLSEAFAEGVPPEAIRDRAGQLSRDVLRDYLTISDRTRQSMANRSALADKWHL